MDFMAGPGAVAAPGPDPLAPNHAPRGAGLMTDSKRLVATLTAPARGALERAAERALRERHATIELEHLLLELCRGQDTDLAFLMRNERLDPQPLQAGLEAAVARFTSGSPRIPA